MPTAQWSIDTRLAAVGTALFERGSDAAQDQRAHHPFTEFGFSYQERPQAMRLQ
ncbi:hypothetical protein [Pelagerythrobacter rhizovicinus]|uniref:hypothetical protein n=1 Tax=Pelagerythrobacter rhizovicinus TaxID=2268576 RepID=UPI0013ECA6C0|nr:hypothetical protein [Pelagerythrobacter rhizovicinus]